MTDKFAEFEKGYQVIFRSGKKRLYKAYNILRLLEVLEEDFDVNSIVAILEVKVIKEESK